MKICYIFFLIIIGFLTCGYENDVKDIYVSAIYQPNVAKLEEIFKQNIKPADDIIYTKVPRGLILSVGEKYLFDQGNALLQLNCICFLDVIAEILRTLPNDCVIEDHTEDDDLTMGNFGSHWELSVARSGNIVQYLVQYGHVPAGKLFAVGYGEFMPFKDNVAPLPKAMMNDRIDFVILEYEAKR